LESDKIRKRAKNNAYSLLRIRPRSEFEVKRRLKTKGYSDPVIAAVVDELKKQGDIDDGKFAKFWVDSRLHMNPVGDVILRHELKEKGVSDPLIEAALEAKDDSYDEYEAAFSMAKERFARFKKMDRRMAAKRVYDFLLRRGFKYDNIRKVIGDLVAGGADIPEEG